MKKLHNYDIWKECSQRLNRMEDIKRKAFNYVNRQGKWDTFGTKVNGHLRLAPTLWNK
jgi:hypothetical protein